MTNTLQLPNSASLPIASDLLARYVWGFCRNDVDLLTNCFTADAEVRFPNGWRRGRPAIMEELKRRRDGWSGQWIQVNNVLIVAHSERRIHARACNAVVETKDGLPHLTTTGWYDDVLRLDNEEWRIVRRQVHLGNDAVRPSSGSSVTS